MPAGLRVRDAFGNVVWDSTTVVGGIFADVREFPSSATGVIQYPEFAGAQVDVVHDNSIPGGANVTVSAPSGVPTVTIGAASGPRRFRVLLY